MIRNVPYHERDQKMMTNDRQIVELIERASDAEPMCPCGRHTTPEWRDGAVWLECASLGEPHEGRLARIVAALTAPAHTRHRIVDVPAMSAEGAAA
jgi:hypothetical protein